MSQGPIKVASTTKERIRYAAAMRGCTQAELVDVAVAEYVERHRAELFEGLRRAREALDGGMNATVAYLTDVPREEIDRVASDRPLSAG